MGDPIMRQTPIKLPIKLCVFSVKVALAAVVAGITITGINITGIMGQRAIAQSAPACEPPAAGEYLLLVVSESGQTPEQLRRTLPPNASTTVCRYLDNTVTRVGGFTDAEVANSWAQYLSDLGGMQAFVARPSEATSTQAQAPNTQPAPSTETLSYNPQPLAAGYAVLVDYFNRPEAATDVQQVLGSQVGLVSYGQRPYLLALHTSDAAVANSVLQRLSDRNFLALVVDSRRVILLTPAVASVD
ncbi:hypothetical protein [Leptolyngbya sp. FACHB-671]|uniref:hypothetical protein n=1 Tax=Leptolyngbya sp. FACHB-671 TaxID=2692812 RepID=UPI0018F03620|nr:hypothetical protein [Leptolyngbya sp. FACHB-671]